MRLRLLLIGILTAGLSRAQDPPRRYFEPYAPGTARVADALPAQQPGSVSIQADPAIERLMERYAATKHPQPGFRVQIYLGSERKAAEDIKRAYLQKNPEGAAYLSWLAPNWRLRVGDCRTRLEAERLLRDLKAQYPGSYIVPDEIEMAR